MTTPNKEVKLGRNEPVGNIWLMYSKALDLSMAPTPTLDSIPNYPATVTWFLWDYLESRAQDLELEFSGSDSSRTETWRQKISVGEIQNPRSRRDDLEMRSNSIDRRLLFRISPSLFSFFPFFFFLFLLCFRLTD